MDGDALEAGSVSLVFHHYVSCRMWAYITSRWYISSPAVVNIFGAHVVHNGGKKNKIAVSSSD